MSNDPTAQPADSALPSPSGVVQRVLQLLGQDSATLPLIGQALGADPVMTGRVIRLANSAVYGVRPAAASLHDAMQRIGLNAMRQVLISFALVERYRDGPCREFNYQAFWAQSLVTGILARRLASLKRLPSPSEAFTVGLLSRVGELALASLHPLEYGALHQTLLDENASRVVSTERARFGTDRYQLAEKLIREWQLPDTMATAVRACGEPAAAGLLPHAMSLRVARLLQIAVQAGKLFETVSPADPQAIQALRQLCEASHVPADELSAELPAILAEWREWAVAMDLILRGTAPESLLPPQAAEIIPFPGTNVQSAVPQQAGTSASSSTGADVTPQPAAPLAPPAKVHQLVAPVARSQAFVDAVRRIHRMQSLDCLPAQSARPLRIVLAHPPEPRRDVLFDLLCAQGHEVLMAETGNAALGLAVRENTHVVVVDLALREMDALTFMHCLRNQRSGREVYAIAAGQREQVGALESAFGAGADDFLGLPARAGEVVARLRGARRFIDLQERWRADNAEMRRLAGDLATANARLEGLVDIDELTGMPNRRRATECLAEAVARAEERGQALSVFLLDLDHFSELNASWGSAVGDEVLRQAARALQSCARAEDVVARFGGEEFLVIAPGTAAVAAAAMAERLRLGVARVRVPTAEGEVTPTFSVGASVYDPMVTRRRRTPEGLLHLADEALYRAKDSGRNRVCVAAERQLVTGE
ncbi:MAG: HDOD domain-containing protein [Pseudomonadota bacterium]|nr:HDOD domain-containing protein [Pseudomonadota bacterium]